MMGDFLEEPEKNLKKANVRLLIALIVFALALTALVITWMHLRSERIYQEQQKNPPAISSLDSRQFSC